MLALCHNYFNVPPNHKSGKDAAQPFNKRRFLFGLFILLLVDVLWVVSSELTKHIYTDIKFERPFMVTYMRSSLLVVYFIILSFIPPTRENCRPADYTQLVEPTAETDEDNSCNDLTDSLGDPMFVPVRAGETTDSDDAAPRAVRFNKVAEVRVMSAAQAGEALLARLSWRASVRATEDAQRRAAAAATRRHLRLAVCFAVPWFISNYLYRLSLLHTTTSVATIYTTTTSAFALSLGAIFAQVPSDRFTLSKTLAVLLSATGLVILGTVDGKHGDWTAVLAALGSAFCYAVHLTMFRRELRKPDGIDAPLLAGLVGCACALLAWCLGGALSAARVERASLPAPHVWSWLLVDAALGPLLYEALWLWGCSLTSAQVATSSLSLAAVLPLALGWWRGAGGGAELAGGLLALAGWLLAVADPACLRPRNAGDRLSSLSVGGSAVEVLSTDLRAIRIIPELDEQSEALISADEPT